MLRGYILYHVCIERTAYKLDRKAKRIFGLDGAISFDSRLLKFGETCVSLWTLQGRKQISFVCGEHQRNMLTTQQGESKLSLQDGNFYLLAACEIPEESASTPQGVLGVDLGIENIATDSDSVPYGGHVRKRRSRFHKTRRSLQRTNTKSAKRKLNKRAKKEHRFSQDVNHCIAKQLVNKAKRTEQGISLEDLKGIRLGNRVSRQLRRELHSWAFYDLLVEVLGMTSLRLLLGGVDKQTSSCWRNHQRQDGDGNTPSWLWFRVGLIQGMLMVY